MAGSPEVAGVSKCHGGEAEATEPDLVRIWCAIVAGGFCHRQRWLARKFGPDRKFGTGEIILRMGRRRQLFGFDASLGYGM